MDSKIKSILYLDKHKLYSISSQVFEGFTENVTKVTSHSSENSEDQRGPHFSGRLLASIVASAGSVAETRFLHDHSYVTLERELESKGKVLQISSASANLSVEQILAASFVKVRGNAEIMDLRKLRTVMSQFNKLGVSMTTVTAAKQLQEEKEKLQEQSGVIKDRNARAVHKAKIDKKLSPEAVAKASGHHLDQDFLKALDHLMEFGFGDQCQIDMVVAGEEGEDIRLSSVLDRELLREPEDRIIAKYSMFPQRELVVFGIPVQGPSAELDSSTTGEAMPSIKQAVLEMVRKLSLLNAQFTGCGPNEVMVDPIAIYLEL